MIQAEKLRENGRAEGKIEGRILEKQHLLFRFLDKSLKILVRSRKER